MGEDFTGELQNLRRYYYEYDKENFNLKAREVLTKAFQHITDLQSQIEKYSNERETLIKRLNTALESEKKAYEKLADLDISRYAEVADLRQEVEKLKTENKRLIKDKSLDKLKKELEIKKLHLEDSENNLFRISETLRELESKYKDLAERYKAVEAERDTLKEKIDDIATKETPLYLDRFSREQLNLKIAELKSKIDNLTKENNHLRYINSLMEKQEKEREEQIRLSYLGELERLNSIISLKEKEILRLKTKTEEMPEEKTEAKKLLQAKTEEIEGLSSEVEKLKSEKERLSVERAELYLKLLRAEEAGRGKEDIDRAKSELEHIKAELNTLRKDIEDKERELKEKTEEISALKNKHDVALEGLSSEGEKLRDEISRLSSERHELYLKLSRAEGEISALKESRVEVFKGIEEILARTFYPMIIDKQDKETKKPSQGFSFSLKKVAVIVIALLAIAGGIYAFRERLPLQTLLVNTPQIKEPSAIKNSSTIPHQGMPWAGVREIEHENFIVDVTFLSPEIIDNLGIPLILSDEEKAQNYLYLLEIKAGKECIPEDVINSLFQKIAFINEDGTFLKPAELPLLETGKRIVYKVKGCKGKTGVVLFRYPIAINKTHTIKGIIIEGLIKDSPLIIK